MSENSTEQTTEHEIDIAQKYQPLFDLPLARKVIRGESDELDMDYARKLAKVDTVVMSGGRNSGKSYVLGLFDSFITAEHEYKTLFTRYTLTSAKDSIIPNFMAKMEALGYADEFKTVENTVKAKNPKRKGSVVFKGIKTSGGNQTAALKSLEDFSCFIVDEAEEVPDFETWQKIYLSIRTSTHQNLSIISFNPPDDEHWIYKEFFAKRGVPGCSNIIKDNVMYIHTTYLDLNPDFVSPSILREFSRMREEDPEAYAQICLGEWTTYVKGALFNPADFERFEEKDFKKGNITRKIGFIDVADKGVDYLSFPIGYCVGRNVYVYDWYFTQEDSSVTLNTCAEYINHHELDIIAVETNGVGSIFASQIRERIREDSMVMFVHQSTNKHTRIVTNAAGVRFNIIFRKDYEPGSMYEKGIRQFFRYNKDKSENEFDDAADSITGLKMLNDDLN